MMIRFENKSKKIKKIFIKCLAVIVITSFFCHNIAIAQAMSTGSAITPEQKRENAVLMARDGDYTNAILIFENELKVNSALASDEVVFDYMAILGWAGKGQQLIKLYEQKYNGKDYSMPAFVKRIVADAYYGAGQYAQANRLYLSAKNAGDDMALRGFRKTQFLLDEIDEYAIKPVGKSTLSAMSNEDKQEVAVIIARSGKYKQALFIFEEELKATNKKAPDNIVKDYMTILNWASQNVQVTQIYEGRYEKEPTKLGAFLQRIVADSYYKQNKFALAQKLYALAMTQKDPASAIGFEKTQLWLGEKTVDSKDVSIVAMREYAVELARINEFTKAINVMNNLIKNNTEDKQAFYDLIAIYNWAGQNDKAIEIYETNFAKQPEKMSTFTQKTVGNVYLALGKYQDAKKLYLLAAANGDKAARISAAEIDARTGNLKESMRILDEIVAKNPEDFNGYVTRANAYMKAGAYISASADYNKALSLVSFDDFATRQQIISTRAALFIAASEFAEARDLLDPYIKNQTATPIMQADYIVSLQGTGEYARAVKVGEEMWLDKTKVPVYGLRALGDCYLRLRKYSKAIEYHSVVIEKNTPEKRSSMLSYAFALAAKNKVSKAKKAYKQVIEEFPQTKGIVAGDAKGLFERNRFHAAKAVFRVLADNNPSFGPYRQQLAFDLYINEMPREAYTEYKKLAQQTNSKEIGYAGMAQSAIAFGDYQAAKSALKELEKYDTNAKEAVEANKAWDNRWRGSFEIGHNIFENYQNKENRLAGMALETSIGSSWRLLASLASNSYKELADKQNIISFSSGLGYIARNFDIRAWGTLNNDATNKAGYRVLANYYFNDFMWFTYDEQKSSVTAPQAIEQGIMNTTRAVSINRRVGEKDLYTVGYLWDEYSDTNKNKGFNVRFSHRSLTTERKEIEWYLAASQYNWDFESPFYDSPARRTSYGPGLRMRWIKPRVGYWEFVTELNSGYDLPDRNDFSPFFRLEKGFNLSANSLLVIGAEYGSRTNRTNLNSDMNFGYRQIDIRYYLTW